MIKLLSACTEEIDDVAAAVDEILSRLDLENNQRKYSAGIMQFYQEFIDSGVVKAVCDALPFDVIGQTTVGTLSNVSAGQLQLTLSVMTSDDVEFYAGKTDRVADEAFGPVKKMCAEISKRARKKPAVVFTVLPTLFTLSGDDFVAALNEGFGGAPVFGAGTVNGAIDLSDMPVMYNGECDPRILSAIALVGPVEPKFFVSRIEEDNEIEQKAIITSSNGNAVFEINDMSFLDYMIKIKILKPDDPHATRRNRLVKMTMTITRADGSTVERAFLDLSPEGYGYFCGTMPQDSAIIVKNVNYDSVIKSSERAVNEIAAVADGKNVLLVSCLTRMWALGSKPDDEVILIRKGLGAVDCVYSGTYSGGEICPCPDINGKSVNSYHNATLVACVFD